MYNSTAKQIGDEIEISYYPTPEPRELGNSRWKIANPDLPKWLKTIKKAYLKKEFNVEMLQLIYSVWERGYYSFEGQLKEGILIDKIKDRLELTCLHCGYVYKDKNYAHDFACPPPGPEPFFILKPEPVEESQEYIIKELIDCIDIATTESYGYGSAINIVKSKFTIIRNKSKTQKD